MNEIFKKEDLAHCLEVHGVKLSDKATKQFAMYAKLLVEWNQKMNLTAIVEENEIYEKHFLDSILPSFDVPLRGHLCDVGAGAGFPSIPLKLVYPDLRVTIVEPLGKRITFLKELCSALNLDDVELVNARAEDYAQSNRESFDIVSARAVANLPMLAELCIPLVKKDGLFLAMKGANGRIEAEEANSAVSKLGCTLQAIYEVSLSDGSKRMNLVYYKEKACALKYPRAFAQIKKHPL